MNEPLEMLTVSEAAQKYGVAVFAVRRWIKTGDLPAVFTGKRALIADSNLQQFLLNGSKQPATEPLQHGKIRKIF